MKRILFLVPALIMFSCAEDDASPSIESEINSVQELAASGDWIITYYYDAEDETSYYEGYTFKFLNDGKISVTKGDAVQNGTWSVTRDDDDENDIDFNILFVGDADFEELSDDWDIISRTDSKIELADDNDEPGNEEYLTFERK